MDTRIPRIWEKIEQARKMYPQLEKEFGVKHHKFQMRPPLPPSKLETFENAHSIKLPQDYADFLTYIGNGGAGPFYGILPLSKWNDVTGTNISLTNPSIFTKELCQDEVWEEYESQLENYGEEWVTLFDGTITICNQGCSGYAVLIVSGEHRGKVCYVNTNEGTPCLIKGDFLTWYECWLDGMLTRDKQKFAWRNIQYL